MITKTIINHVRNVLILKKKIKVEFVMIVDLYLCLISRTVDDVYFININKKNHILHRYEPATWNNCFHGNFVDTSEKDVFSRKFWGFTFDRLKKYIKKYVKNPQESLNFS